MDVERRVVHLVLLLGEGPEQIQEHEVPSIRTSPSTQMACNDHRVGAGESLFQIQLQPQAIPSAPDAQFRRFGTCSGYQAVAEALVLRQRPLDPQLVLGQRPLDPQDWGRLGQPVQLRDSPTILCIDIN